MTRLPFFAIAVLMFVLIGVSPPSFALTVERIEEVALLIQHVQELQGQKIISEEQAAAQLKQLNEQGAKIVGESVTNDQILTWQRDHATSWFSVCLRVIGALFGLVGVLGALYFLSPLLIAVPLVAYEFAGMIACLFLAAKASPLNYLGVALGAASVVAFSYTELKGLRGSTRTRTICVLLMLVFGYSTVMTNAVFMGALSVGALICLSGLVLSAGDGWFAAGFDSVQDTVTTMIVGMLVTIAGAVAPHVPFATQTLAAFVPGALILGTVSVGICSLVIGLRDFKGNYWLRQVVASVVIVVGALAASVMNVEYVSGILGTFAFFYLASKLYDIYMLVRYWVKNQAAIMLLVGSIGLGLCWTFAWFAERYPLWTVVGMF